MFSISPIQELRGSGHASAHTLTPVPCRLCEFLSPWASLHSDLPIAFAAIGKIHQSQARICQRAEASSNYTDRHSLFQFAIRTQRLGKTNYGCVSRDPNSFVYSQHVRTGKVKCKVGISSGKIVQAGPLERDCETQAALRRINAKVAENISAQFLACTKNTPRKCSRNSNYPAALGMHRYPSQRSAFRIGVIKPLEHLRVRKMRQVRL
jgi:hypothetical protein